MSNQTELLIDTFKYCDPEELKQAVIARQKAATCLTTEILEGQAMLPNPVTDAICEILDDVVQLKRKRVIITIPPGYGKCSHKDSLVLTRRGYIPASEVVVGDDFCSFDAGLAVWSKCLSVENYRKECKTIKTRTGRVYTASHDHPIKTQRGWTKLDDIQSGVHYAVALNAELDFGERLPDAELDLITLLLFEGSCSQETTGFTSADKEVVRVMQAACDGLGMELLSSDGGINYRLKGCNVEGRSIAKGLRAKYGINGLAKYKQFPSQFDNLPIDQRWRFVGLMLATDGWISKRGNQFGVSIASASIANGCQRMLASCGVPSVITHKENTHAGCYEVIVSAAHAQKVSGKVDALHKQHKFASFSGKRRNCYIDAYPAEVFGGGSRSRDIAAGIRTDSLKKHITQRRWASIIKAYPEYDDESLHDFHYDVIVSVQDAGLQDVVHFSVDRTENYVSDGIVTHNTMNCVWSFVSRGLVVNPAARFFHTSYSNDLVLDNSSKVKQILESEPYEYFNGKLNIVNDTRSKGLWRTEEGGGLRAVPIGGGLAGFRAGQVDKDKFTGCFIADDLLKPDDATSRVICAAQNRRYNTSISSRLAHEDVPIVMIMQRIVAYPGEFNTSDDLANCGDMVEYLLRGGSGERWDHLMLPALIDNSIPYPKEWTHGDPIEHNLPDGPLWDHKHKLEDIERLKAADKYTYAAQYDQRPKKRIGEPMISGEWFQYFSDCPPLKAIEIFADTASKTAERNDYSVLMVAGVTHDDKLMILDVVRGKWKIPELYKKTESLWELWKGRGATRIQIEDANSGTYLIQQLEIKLKKSVVGIPRLKDKFTRVNGIIETISSGNVYLPDYGLWVDDFIDECEAFTDDDSHMNDDQVDCLVDAVERLLPMRKGATFRMGIQGAA